MAMPSFAELLSVRETGQDVYESVEKPVRMGNIAPIAYGGCTMGVAISSAHLTVPRSMHAYSILGHFLGPAQTDRKLICRVLRLRDTKTFATRRVITEQKLDNGSTRVCLELTVDFQVKEPARMTFSRQPRQDYGSVEDAKTVKQLFDSLHQNGHMKASDYKKLEVMFGVAWNWLDQRYVTSSVSGQNISGAAKTAPTTQDHLPIAEKISVEWTRLIQPLTAELQIGGLAFFMDQGLSFLPLTHNHEFLEDVGACSTLDFALRVFTPDLKLEEWYLRERDTSVADAGRTYSEGRLFDAQGRLVASMTQQCIMRPKPPPKQQVRPSL